MTADRVSVTAGRRPQRSGLADRVLPTVESAARHPLVTALPLVLASRVLAIARSGVILGGDSPLYVAVARSFAEGSPSAGDYPFHVVYGILLSPAERFSLNLEVWVALLHLALAAGATVALLRVCRIFLGPVPSLAVVVGFALLPTALFWFPYVLTETLFVFVLSVFCWFAAEALVRPSRRRYLAMAAAGMLLTLSRPVGLPIVVVASAVICWHHLYSTQGRRRANRTLFAGAVVVATVVGALLAIPRTRAAVAGNETVTYSLWNSTRIWNSDIDHVRAGTTLPPDLRKLDEGARIEEMRHRSLEYIRQSPAEYLRHAGIRFGHFWFPWVSASWSLTHRLWDAILSLSLVGAGLYAVARARDTLEPSVVRLLASLALAQGVLVMFSQIDSEARYRLPAEITLLPLVGVVATAAWGRFVDRAAR